MSSDDPFRGWTPASVGCHWSRALPDGREVHMSTWQSGSGKEGGYSLTIDYETTNYPDLAAALAAYKQMANL
jgi:hypothetical protein